MRNARGMRGVRVHNARGRKVGKISEVVFAPGEKRVVGYMVDRPDVLWMVKRKDRFLAYDSVSVVDDKLYAKPGRGVWDSSALARLGVDFDDCIIWRNMPARTVGGRDAGRVVDLAFDERDGRLLGVRVSDGVAATALVGTRDIPASKIRSCDASGVTLENAALAVEVSGGAAATAGKAAAVATKRVADTANATLEAAGKATDAVRKRTSGMFSSFAEEFKSGMRDED